MEKAERQAILEGVRQQAETLAEEIVREAEAEGGFVEREILADETPSIETEDGREVNLYVFKANRAADEIVDRGWMGGTTLISIEGRVVVSATEKIRS